MPKIAEIREIDGQVWARVDMELPSPLTIWTEEECQAALLAERLSATERAAKIAESCGDTFSNSRDMYVAVQEAAVDAKVIEIAAAIRSQP